MHAHTHTAGGLLWCAAGGERILDVFELKLKDAINKLPFTKILTLRNVQNVVNEADGYQPHIIAPENGYR
jgi:dynamin 1-like protein